MSSNVWASFRNPAVSLYGKSNFGSSTGVPPSCLIEADQRGDVLILIVEISSIRLFRSPLALAFAFASW